MRGLMVSNFTIGPDNTTSFVLGAFIFYGC